MIWQPVGGVGGRLTGDDYDGQMTVPMSRAGAVSIGKTANMFGDKQMTDDGECYL